MTANSQDTVTWFLAPLQEVDLMVVVTLEVVHLSLIFSEQILCHLLPHGRRLSSQFPLADRALV